MFSLVADDNMLLKDVELFIEPVEVYDPAGKLLGLFVPANLERCKEIAARADAQIDWAEIKRMAQASEECYPFEDVLERLQLLQAESDRRKATGIPDFTSEEAVAFVHSLRQQKKQSQPISHTEGIRTEQNTCAPS